MLSRYIFKGMLCCSFFFQWEVYKTNYNVIISMWFLLTFVYIVELYEMFNRIFKQHEQWHFIIFLILKSWMLDLNLILGGWIQNITIFQWELKLTFCLRQILNIFPEFNYLILPLNLFVTTIVPDWWFKTSLFFNKN